MTSLSEIFRDMSHIVLEQDSILNRIDYNIESSLKDV
jgi:t-SNARE complex subunit (syntaxin)